MITESGIVDKDLLEKWQQYFIDDADLQGELQDALFKEEPLNIDYYRVDRYSPDLADRLLDGPHMALVALQEALKLYSVNNGLHASPREIKVIEYSIINLPEIVEVGIAALRHTNLDVMTRIEGNIIRATDVKQRVTKIAFQCVKCGGIFYVEQNGLTGKFREPAMCTECDRASKFKPLFKMSTYEDFQKLLITNPYYETQRKDLVVHCSKHLVNKALPGQTTAINGIYEVKEDSDKAIVETFFKAVGFDTSQQKPLTFTPAELERAQEIAGSPNLWETLLDSFAPSLYGAAELKQSILLQLFGGSWHKREDGTLARGSINLLLVGDPGTVKSCLMDACERVSPVCTRTAGGDVTPAGITAAAVKDPFGEGGWVLQAGAAVKANTGICCLDEFSKMPVEVHDSLRGAMEQGKITISKAGIYQELPARTAIFAATNPKYGHYDDYQDFFSQVEISGPLLSRFDLIFVVRDQPDEHKDEKIAWKIYSTSVGSNYLPDKEPPMDPDFLRKYIHYSHQLDPRITPENYKRVVEWYLDKRSRTKGEVKLDPSNRDSKRPDAPKSRHYGARHLQAIIRLSQASARARLSEEVDFKDIETAIHLFDGALSTTGVEDFDDFYTRLAPEMKKILFEVRQVREAKREWLEDLNFDEIYIDRLIGEGYLIEEGGKIRINEKNIEMRK